MKKTGIRLLLWAAVLATAVMIFAFSAQTADESAQLSGTVVEQVLEVLGVEDPPEETVSLLDTLARKSGHFLEYMLLGFWAMLLAGSYDLRYRAAIAWGGSTLYAVTDELHQLGVEGRAGMFTDVLIDSGGVLAGVLAAMLLVRFLGRIHRKR